MIKEERIVDARNLVDRNGFVKEFWRVLQIERRYNPNVSRREVYEWLNGVYYVEYGVDAFPSFNAFRHSKEFRGQR